MQIDSNGVREVASLAELNVPKFSMTEWNGTTSKSKRNKLLKAAEHLVVERSKGRMVLPDAEADEDSKDDIILFEKEKPAPRPAKRKARRPAGSRPSKRQIQWIDAPDDDSDPEFQKETFNSSRRIKAALPALPKGANPADYNLKS